MRFWFGLSLVFAITYSILGLQEAFSSEYVVQDDARQHVFWMQRFLEPDLFSQDLIANYFQSVAPSGYTALYRLMAGIGINPLTFNKFLPLILCLITTGYCFGVCLEILPVPLAGFISSLLLNQTLWMKDGLISGTPRAFVYPLLLAFLYYLLRRSWLICLVTIALQGLFYPQSVFLCVGILILQLGKWKQGQFYLSQEPCDYLFCAAGLGVAVLVLLPYALSNSEFGPVITASEASTLPEFLPGGRASFFSSDFWNFWFNDKRSGMLPRRKWLPFLVYAAFLLPLLLPFQFPLNRQIKREVSLLAQIILVSIGLFFVAHVLLFKLHLPSRYTQYSLRIALALAAAIALVLMLDAVLRWASKPRKSQQRKRQVIGVGIVGFIGIVLVFYPNFLNDSFSTSYVVGEQPALYKFFSEQPKNSLVASLAREADNLPTFSKQPVLVSQEYGIPYHVGYYRQFRQRAINLIQAQYSPRLRDIQSVIQTYSIDFWLLDRDAFTPDYIASNSWLKQYQPAATEAQTSLEQGTVPALVGEVELCSIFETKYFIVLEAECIANTRSS